jgi:hypothetical protein
MDAYSLAEDILYRELETRLDQVINGEQNSIEIKFLYANEVATFLKNKYDAHVETSDMDTNGWQYDYWIPVYINDEKYNLMGSGYYGDMEFVKEEDEE